MGCFRNRELRPGALDTQLTWHSSRWKVVEGFVGIIVKENVFKHFDVEEDFEEGFKDTFPHVYEELSHSRRTRIE